MFFDDFNRPNELLDVSSDWTTLLGEISVQNNRAVNTSGSGQARCRCEFDTGNTDHYAEALIYTSQTSVSNCPSLLVRHSTTASTFYALRVARFDIQMFKLVNGSFSTISSVVTVGNDWNGINPEVWRFTAEGDQLIASRGGAEVLRVTDTQITTETNTGFYAGIPGESNNWVDDFRADELGAAPALDAPANVNAFPVSQTEISVEWGAVIGATGYEVEIDGGTPVDVGNVLEYADTGLTAETSRDYRVRAYDGDGAGAWSAIASATTLSEPAAPSAPSATRKFFALQRRVGGVWA